MSPERFAWIHAYLKHFTGTPPAAVLTALGVDDAAFSRAKREHLRAMSSALLAGDHGPSQRFASELALATAKLSEQKPTLEDVRATYGKQFEAPITPTTDQNVASLTNPDETVMMRAYLPNVVLPFQPSAQALPPVAPAPGPQPAARAPNDPDMTVIPSPAVRPAAALPFEPPAAPAAFDPDATLPIAPPKKP